nr:uncharacterized protein LOC128687809 [Cherax quadricarinatus]
MTVTSQCLPGLSQSEKCWKAIVFPGKHLSADCCFSAQHGCANYGRGAKKASASRLQSCLRGKIFWAKNSKREGVTFTMHENITTNGVFRGIDKDVLSVQVQNLKTPAIIYPWAMVRVPDVLIDSSFNLIANCVNLCAN